MLGEDRALWRPISEPQRRAFECDADVVGYGGAGGGGKTDLMIGKAILKHKRTLVMRKTAGELIQVIDRIEEIIGTREGLSGNAGGGGIWRLPLPGNRTINFGSVPNLGDERKYRGRAHDLLVVDEAQDFYESAFKFLTAWLRSVDERQKCQVLLTFNPPSTQEGRWLVKMFAPWVDPGYKGKRAVDGELRYFVTVSGEDIEVDSPSPVVVNSETYTPLSRTFFHARVIDNPFYRYGQYIMRLQALPEPLRSQMLHGDFAAGIGDDPWQVIPSEYIKIATERWKNLDPKPAMSAMGVDVARGGKDKTTIARRHGMWFDVPLCYTGASTPDGPTVAGLVIAALRNRAPIAIDVGGVGASPYDFLNSNGQSVHPINFGSAANSVDKSGILQFANLRSQLWWKMREALDPVSNNGIALPPDKDLIEELSMPRFEMRGKAIYVESRDELLNAKRLGRSPDLATAYILALMDLPRRQDLQAPQRRDYDAVGAWDDAQRGNSVAPSQRRDYDPSDHIFSR